MSNFINELRDYSNIPRALVYDTTLSDRARFLYVYMACKPDDWDFVLEPMSKELGYTKETIRKYMKELVDRGWLVKGNQMNSGGVFGSVQYLLAASRITDTENFRLGDFLAQDKQEDIDKRELKEKERKEEKALKRKEILESFEKCWIAYDRKGQKKVALERWKRLSDDDRKKIEIHIPFYMKSNERKFLKDFERYISNRVFDSIVVDHDNGNVLYDPERESGSLGYAPTCGRDLSWNDYYNCYMYIGMFVDQMYDGYTDDNRPNGARVTLNNGRGTIVWDSDEKAWKKE